MLYLARLSNVMPSTCIIMVSMLRRSTRFTARETISTSSRNRVICDCDDANSSPMYRTFTPGTTSNVRSEESARKNSQLWHRMQDLARGSCAAGAASAPDS